MSQYHNKLACPKCGSITIFEIVAFKATCAVCKTRYNSAELIREQNNIFAVFKNGPKPRPTLKEVLDALEAE